MNAIERRAEERLQLVEEEMHGDDLHGDDLHGDSSREDLRAADSSQEGLCLLYYVIRFDLYLHQTFWI